MTPALPDKEYFKIGEVAALVGVKPYVLRYWESEFKRDIKPARTSSNQRMYRRHDVETFLEIKRLRYDEQLELSGARRRLRRGDPTSASDGTPELPFVSAGGDTEDGAIPGRVAAEATLGYGASPSLSAAAAKAARERAKGAPSAELDELRGRLRKGLEELIRIVDEDEGGE